MMKKFLLVLVLFVVSSVAHAAVFIVNVGGSKLTFTPQTVTIDPGDTVTFINRGGTHNAVADDGSFRCALGCDGDGHNGNGHPSNANWTASVTFDKPGTVGYFCEIHGAPGMGMYGTIIVTGQTQQSAPKAVPVATYSLYVLLALALIAAASFARRRRN